MSEWNCITLLFESRLTPSDGYRGGGGAEYVAIRADVVIYTTPSSSCYMNALINDATCNFGSKCESFSSAIITNCII